MVVIQIKSYMSYYKGILQWINMSGFRKQDLVKQIVERELIPFLEENIVDLFNHDRLVHNVPRNMSV